MVSAKTLNQSLNQSSNQAFNQSFNEAFNWTIAAKVMCAEVEGVDLNVKITGISSDTRTLKAGNLFFALSGEIFDGHKFVDQAFDIGAAAIVVSADWFHESKKESKNAQNHQNSHPFLIVNDVLRAYQDLANWWRLECDLPVIAITGSAGKTTTKEIMSQLLSFFGRVHKSVANHNNDIGVAQTLLSINPHEHDFVVVEMGMRGLGEIARLAAMAAPNVAVITNIGTAHIGRLGSQEMIAKAKCELLESMPSQGVAVLNGEDVLLLEAAAKVWQGKILTFDLGSAALNISNGFEKISEKISEKKPEKLEAKLIENHKLQINNQSWHLPLPGRHNAMNFLAGLAAVKALGLDLQKINTDIKELNLPTGRSQIYQISGNITILDETYNASPEAMIAALHLLAQTSTTGRRWAVLGAMKELGEKSAELHVQVGKVVKDLNIDCLLVLIDGESNAILKAAGNDFKHLEGCENHHELVKKLLSQAQSGDTILFKASHSVGMDAVVAEFRAAWTNLHE